MAEYTYESEVKWLGEKKTLAKTKNGEIEIVSPPEFDGHAGKFCPEDLLPSLVAACLLTTFITFKDKMNINLHSWKSKSIAHIEPSPEKGFMFSKIELFIKLKVDEKDKDQVPRAMELAEKYCFVSRAIKGNVKEIIHYELL